MGLQRSQRCLTDRMMYCNGASTGAFYDFDKSDDSSDSGISGNSGDSNGSSNSCQLFTLKDSED